MATPSKCQLNKSKIKHIMSNITTEVKKGELFVKEVLKRLVGDDNEALALKIARKSISAVQGQVSALQAKEIDDENNLEEAEEALAIAKYPTELFKENKVYCDNIVRAQSKVDEAKEVLEATKESITFFKGLLESF